MQVTVNLEEQDIVNSVAGSLLDDQDFKGEIVGRISALVNEDDIAELLLDPVTESEVFQKKVAIWVRDLQRSQGESGVAGGILDAPKIKAMEARITVLEQTVDLLIASLIGVTKREVFTKLSDAG